jgi:hypothetical protein
LGVPRAFRNATGTLARYDLGVNERKQAFLLNLWLEADGVETPASRGWRRGSVEHLESRRRLYFSDVAELLDFLASCGGRRDLR